MSETSGETSPAAGGSSSEKLLEKVCLVRLGEALFAIPGRHGKGVVQLGTWTQVPRSIPALLGVVHLHGAIVPVVDGAALVGFSPLGDPVSQILTLLLEIGGNPVALRVEEVVAFEPLDLGQVEHPLGRVCVLDVERLITSLRVEQLPA